MKYFILILTVFVCFSFQRDRVNPKFLSPENNPTPIPDLIIWETQEEINGEWVTIGYNEINTNGICPFTKLKK